MIRRKRRRKPVIDRPISVDFLPYDLHPMRSLSRRSFIQTAIETTAGASLCAFAAAPTWSRSSPVVATPLGQTLVLLTGAGANVVAASGPDGAVLVDGGLEESSGEMIKAALRATSAKRVQVLLNTHWHPEQTGSNERLGGSGTKIIAHENTKLWLTRKIVVDWRPGSYGPMTPKGLPTQTIYRSATMALGEEPVEYGYLPQAHTDGDIYVYFRKSNVLAAGGVLSQDGWPVLDFQTGGWIAGLVAGLDRLLKIADDTTRIVPASGGLLTRADLQAQREMYFTIYDRLVKCLNKGLAPEEVLATQPAKEFNPQWGDPSAFVTMAFESLWGHYAPDG
jgi:glyoxylase-like metal-dependent hydrolase (beta-lactamase superfamily II)